MDKNSKILIVGHGGAIEQGLKRQLNKKGFHSIYATTEMALNTTIQSSVYAFFQETRPDYVFLSSVKSGGIQANIDFPADFIFENVLSQSHCLYAAYKFGVKKVLYYGGSCVYPKEAAQPIREDSLLTGPVETTSEAYAVAKIAGIKTAQSFRKQYGLNVITMIPATLYGPQADTDVASAHVLGALMAKFSAAVNDNQNVVTVWGTGNPRREFLYIDDFVEASLFLMKHYDDSEPINVGSGSDISIRELAEMIARIVGFKGTIAYDTSKPDGAKQKLLDSSRINKLGFHEKTQLEEGIQNMYSWYSQTGVAV